MVELDNGAIFAGHRIEAIAGEGGMGVVYRATHLTLEIPVAVKVIRPELAKDAGFRERFKRESRLAASIEHPNVLPVRHAGEENGLLYITMRYVDGTDLRAVIDRDGCLDPVTAVDLLSQVAAALDAAHARGLVHRDVKPANVLIERRGSEDHAYLTDFGLTRRASSQSGLTRTGQWVGTLDYVAPEQIEGKKVDARSDVYALGCMLYEVLTGELPFMRESEVATLYAHLNDPPPSLAEKGPSIAPLDEAVTRSMAKDPGERFQSAGEFAAAARTAISATGAETALSAQRGKTVVSPLPAGATAGAPEIAAERPPAPALSGTKASERPAPQTRPGAPPPPAAQPPRATPPPEPARKSSRGRPRGLLTALGGLLALAIVAGLLLATGVIGGGSDTGDDTAPSEAAARSLIGDFAGSFKNEGQAGIEALLAPDATYKYPGFAPDKPQEEYRNLFATREIHDYQLVVTGVDPVGDSTRVTANYEYNTGPNAPSSGTLSFLLKPDPETGDLKIAEIDPIPDLYVFFDNTAPPASVTAIIRVGSREVAKEQFELAQRAKSIPLRLPIEPGAEQAFNSDVNPQATLNYRDGDGPNHQTFKVDGYPYAS